MWSPNGPSSRNGSRRIHVTFDDEVGIGGNFEVVGFAFHQFDGFLAQVTGEEKFIEAIGQRRGGGEGEASGSPPRKIADGHARAGFVVTAAVARADFLELPVHAGGAVVVNLDAIHADVALAGVGVFGDDAGQGDEAAAVERPAFEDGEIEKRRRIRIELRGVFPIRCRWPVTGRCRRFDSMHDLFAGTGASPAWALRDASRWRCRTI